MMTEPENDDPFALDERLIYDTGPSYSVLLENLMVAIGRFCLHVVGWKPKAQRIYEQMIEKQIRPGLPHRYLDGRVCGCADCRVAMAFDPFGTRQIDRNKSYPDGSRMSDEAITAIGTLTKAVANTGTTFGVSDMTLNQTLLSMGQDPVPGGGQSNKALLTLMQQLEGEIAEPYQPRPEYEEMLHTGYDGK